MAKTKWDINMEFTEAKKQASALEQIAKDIDNFAKNDLENCMQSISSNWKSDNSTAYVKKGRKVETNLQKIASKLKETAGTIRTIAKDTYDTEMKALAIAEARKYKND